MNYRRVKAICKKEYLHIIRDPRSLIMGIIIPMILLFLFGYALDMDVNNINIAIIDNDNSSLSNELINSFKGSDYFNIAYLNIPIKEADKLLKNRKIQGYILISEDYSSNINSNIENNILFIIDGSDSNTASIMISYVKNIISIENIKILSKTLDVSMPLKTSLRIWFNSEMKSRNYIVPGLIAVIMMIIAALLTSLTISREFETGTIEMIIPTPLSTTEIITGKLIPYFGIALFDMLICIVSGYFFFDVPLRGSLILLLLSGSVFICGALIFGVFVSIIGKTQVVSSQIAMVTTFLPAFLLSGFVFDIQNMPVFVQFLTRIISARYFVTLVKGIMLKGIGIDILYKELIFLILFSVFFFVLCLKKFKKQI